MMRVRLFLPVGVVILLVALWAFVDIDANKPFEEAGKIIRFRQIGHELLLSVGDSTSRVLPVRKVSNQEYRLEFESPFALMPDSLAHIIGRMMKKASLPLNYLVTVAETGTDEVVYGFAVSEKDKTVIPCLGRALPKKNYTVNILFSSTTAPVADEKRALYYVLAAGLLGCCLFIFAAPFFRRKVKPLEEKLNNEPVEDANTGAIAIGKYFFYPDKQLLIMGQEQTGLTDKESKLLGIFAIEQNQVIERHRLLKVWEDDGVITGRSLDMYISRLRKILRKEDSLRIKNIHGKGYILHVG